MRTSYKETDVTLLLKDVTGLVKPQSTEEREREIQAGRHYCEMLPIEYTPTKEYMNIYHELVTTFAKKNADAVAAMAEKIKEKFGYGVILVSLARAGIPAAILVKRYIEMRYGVDVKHYSISIIRGRGIDKNAMNYILSRHDAKKIVFVDGWTGKGAIKNQLVEALEDYPTVRPTLAVISDPAGVADIYGTANDLLVPNCCLNSTVSGLISRTFLRDDIIGPNDFHGAVYYEEMTEHDLSYDLIDRISREFPMGITRYKSRTFMSTGLDEAKRIAGQYGISDINKVKPSIGEATRVLLRRVPWKILINEKYKGSIDVAHLVRLAEEKNVPIEYISLTHYIAVGLIKTVADA